jgi:membrane-bound metal-dependent hydrolase YbcI (DUF457 family)
MLATVWLDIIFVPLFLTGIETISPAGPTDSGYGSNIIHADYTHSIIGAAVLSAILGAAAARRWGRRSGVVIGLVCASHWLLDLIVHRADMPILPGSLGDLPRLGLGLWRYPAASIALELGLVMLGAFIYWRSARLVTDRAQVGKRSADAAAALIVLCGVLVLYLDVSGIAG